MLMNASGVGGGTIGKHRNTGTQGKSMDSKPYSDAYVQHLTRGPFPGRVDPWAEAGRYFQQIHSGIIIDLMSQMGPELIQLGYIASKETSLQIVALRKPDVSVQITREQIEEKKHFDYAEAATAVLAEPGFAVEIETSELESIYIRTLGSNILITVIEVISPRNKTHSAEMETYRDERTQLFLDQGVNVVEIDPTRSVKRLFEHTFTRVYPYHVAVFMPGEHTHIIFNNLNEPLKRCAIPLQSEVIGVDVQHAYDFGYQESFIAPQLENATNYHEDALPFPSLLTDSQRQSALEAVGEWHKMLKQLKEA